MRESEAYAVDTCSGSSQNTRIYRLYQQSLEWPKTSLTKLCPKPLLKDNRDLKIRGRERQWTRETFAGPVVSSKTKCLICIFSQRTATSIIQTL